MVKFVE